MSLAGALINSESEADKSLIIDANLAVIELAFFLDFVGMLSDLTLLQNTTQVEARP